MTKFQDLSRLEKLSPFFQVFQELWEPCSKVLEKLIYKRLYSFVNANGTLFTSQYGFRKNHSCKHAILELTGHILQAKNNGEQTACVFLDLSKAFDTLDLQILLAKLEKYGIRGTPLNWFKSYLDGRSLVAKIQTSPNTITYLDRFDIGFGTAQGTCLGPLLFLIFINDIHYLDLYSRLILLADDTTLFNSQKCIRYLQYTIDHDLNMLLNWFKANKLSLNLQKTVMMWFGRTNNSINVVRRCGRLAPRQPLSVCALLPASRK